MSLQPRRPRISRPRRETFHEQPWRLCVQLVVDLIASASNNEPQYSKALERSCRDLYLTVQRVVTERLRQATEGSDAKAVHELYTLGQR